MRLPQGPVLTNLSVFLYTSVWVSFCVVCVCVCVWSLHFQYYDQRWAWSRFCRSLQAPTVAAFNFVAHINPENNVQLFSSVIQFVIRNQSLGSINFLSRSIKPYLNDSISALSNSDSFCLKIKRKQILNVLQVK